MAAERMAHVRVKMAAHNALAAAAADLDCEALGDGMAVRIGEATQREPDAALRCGGRLPPDATFYGDPVILIEVTSPSTEDVDLSTKLIDYAQIESLAHYLIFDLRRGVVVHNQKASGGFFATILPGGALSLDPPGLTLDLDAVLDAAT